MAGAIRSEDFTCRSLDGHVRLVGSVWRAAKPRGAVVVIHGLSDHVCRYRELAEFLAHRGLSVTALDMRGHGRSGGRRGHVEALEQLLDDAAVALQRAHAESPDLPGFLIGHSMGGTVVLNLLRSRGRELRERWGLRGAVVLSPLVLPTQPPPLWKWCAAHVLSVIYPTFSLSTQIDLADLSHDTERVETFRHDPLRHGRASARLAVELFRAGRSLLAGSWPLPCPILMMHGGADRITDPRASARLATQWDSAQCQWQEWSGLYHELCQELVREEVYQRIASWLEQQLRLPAAADGSRTPIRHSERERDV